MLKPTLIAAAILLSAPAGAATGETELLTDPSGITWYLLDGSVSPNNKLGPGVYELWLRGENPQVARPRGYKIKLELACKPGWYVRMTTALIDDSGVNYRTMLQGWAPGNWQKVEAGGALAVAMKHICPA